MFHNEKNTRRLQLAPRCHVVAGAQLAIMFAIRRQQRGLNERFRERWPWEFLEQCLDKGRDGFPVCDDEALNLLSNTLAFQHVVLTTHGL